MMVKAKKQGNSIIVTIPKKYNIKDGDVLKTYRTSNGIAYKLVSRPQVSAVDLNQDILDSLIDKGYSGNDLKKAFHERKEMTIRALLKINKDTLKHNKPETQKEFNHEIGL